MLLELKRDVIYGPVHSRRIGRSLGVNILPAETKLCTFDCLYCHFGWTGAHAASVPAGVGFRAADEILRAVREALETIDRPPECITFSGNGEPTLHPEFPEIARGVIALRDELSPTSRTAILSNSSTACDETVRDALSLLDLRVMKLDCGDDETFGRFNRPCEGVTLDRITEGLASIADVTVQALMAGGPGGNTGRAALDAWLARLEAIRPTKVQIYTLMRDHPSSGIEPVARERLLGIAKMAELRCIRAEVF